MGSLVGVLKIAAKRIGIPFEEYLSRIESGQKWCNRCRTWKNRGEFGPDRTRNDGRSAACIACRYVRTTPGPTKAERRVKFKEGLAWCRGCRAWMPIDSMHAGLCRPCNNKAARDLYATDTRYRLERRQHAHSRKRGVAPISPDHQLALTEEFQGACAYCGHGATSWDHIIPVSEGGGSTKENIVPACSSCNSSKKNQDLIRWLNRTGRVPSDLLKRRLATIFPERISEI